MQVHSLLRAYHPTVFSPSMKNDEVIQQVRLSSDSGQEDETDFVEMILENLKTAGVQQAHKKRDKNCVLFGHAFGRVISFAPKPKVTSKARPKRLPKKSGHIYRPQNLALFRARIWSPPLREAGDAGFRRAHHLCIQL